MNYLHHFTFIDDFDNERSGNLQTIFWMRGAHLAFDYGI